MGYEIEPEIRTVSYTTNAIESINARIRKAVMSLDPTGRGDNPIIRQFFAGRPQGPIGMDEMAEDDQIDDGVVVAEEQPRLDRRYDHEDWETIPGLGGG